MLIQILVNCVMCHFNQEFYGIDPLFGNATSYKELTLLFIFVVDMSIEIEMQFKENVPVNTCAYAVVINDRKWQLRNDRRNMEIQYQCLTIFYSYKIVIGLV